MENIDFSKDFSDNDIQKISNNFRNMSGRDIVSVLCAITAQNVRNAVKVHEANKEVINNALYKFGA